MNEIRLGITGHRDLSAETVAMVTEALHEQVSKYPRVLGVSSLAEGADQLFARTVLQRGGALDAIVPSLEYRSRRDNQAEYDRLLSMARRVIRLPFRDDGPAAHMAASLVLVERCDYLLAVWDGQPARSWAGTADVVAYARQIEVPVIVVWPPGSARAA